MPTFSSAEMQIEVGEEEINVEIIPESPEPYQNVTIKISSYATDLNKAIITWQGQSGVVFSGIGKTVYSFKANGPDTVNIFDINITPVGSMNVLNKRIAIYPSEVLLLWESVDGYAPPFYKGKVLPTSGGLIKVVASPNTNKIKSGNGSVTYTWKNKDKTNLEASGYNKNSYVFKNNIFDDKNTITVMAQTVNGSYGAKNTIEIPVFKPKILFYKKSPTEGIFYNKALDKEDVLTDDQMTIVAEPYYISLKGKENLFTYDWQINGDPISTPSKKRELTIRPTSRGGYATISLVIENINELFQKVVGQLKLTL